MCNALPQSLLHVRVVLRPAIEWKRAYSGVYCNVCRAVMMVKSKAGYYA